MMKSIFTIVSILLLNVGTQAQPLSNYGITYKGVLNFSHSSHDTINGNVFDFYETWLKHSDSTFTIYEIRIIKWAKPLNEKEFLENIIHPKGIFPKPLKSSIIYFRGKKCVSEENIELIGDIKFQSWSVVLLHKNQTINITVKSNAIGIAEALDEFLYNIQLQ